MELVGDQLVDDGDVEFVMVQAHRAGSRGTVACSELKQAISLWRYLQHERLILEGAFEQFDADGDGRLDQGELAALMTSLNDGIAVTPEEVAWVMATASTSQPDGVGKTGLDPDETRGALAVWYPALKKRRRLEDLPHARREAESRPGDERTVEQRGALAVVLGAPVIVPV